jgi:protein-S-isoprenylcysteine O-methyltransferase Ste14
MADKTQARGNDARSEESRAKDLIARGVYTSTPVGKALFVVLRSLEPFLQYQVLAHGAGTSLLHRAGLRTLPPGPAAHTGFPLVDRLGLSSYRLVLLGMTIGSAVKQSIWVTTISGEPMDVPTAVIVSLFNTFLNGLNNYAFLLTATSASMTSDFPQPQLIVGSALYATGLLTELVAEIQRKRFKSDPKNKGKPYTGGLWSLARHINYGAYTIWRAGYAMAGGGWIWGALVGGFFFSDFVRRGVPLLNEYCEKRYGEDWDKFKKQTKYRLIPGVY